jgi:hypothetical protein
MNKVAETNANIESASSFGKFMGSKTLGMMMSMVAGIDRTEYLKIGETSCLDTFI